MKVLNRTQRFPFRWSLKQWIILLKSIGIKLDEAKTTTNYWGIILLCFNILLNLFFTIVMIDRLRKPGFGVDGAELTCANLLSIGISRVDFTLYVAGTHAAFLINFYNRQWNRLWTCFQQAQLLFKPNKSFRYRIKKFSDINLILFFVVYN